ncbi:MAG: acetate--CoA ligase family protein [Patescibacteria group bacterium]|jgi:acetyltransferase
MEKGDIKKLKTFFSPSTIAVVGASADEKKIGNIVVKNLDKFGFKGEVYLVNPHLPDVNGHQVFASYTEIPVIPDVAVLTTPAETIAGLIREIGEKGTKNIVVLAAGFKEIGVSGAELENELVTIAKEFKINILGPNCLGYLSTASQVNATFGMVAKETGNVRFISQSGAIATSMFDWAAANSIGFDEFVTIGNKAGLTENSFLDYWQLNKDNVLITKKQQLNGLSSYKPIGLYLESVSEGQKFVELVSLNGIKNPVIVLKPGKSVAASKAMISHTGALAGDDKIFSAALEMSGAIRAEGIEDMFDLLKVFSWENAPKGPNTAIVSNAGGPAVITTDFLFENNLKLAPLLKRTENKLVKLLPREAALHNPIDVLGDANASRYHDALEAVLADSNVDCVLALLTPQIMTEIEQTAKVICELSARYKKTIICSFMGGSQTDIGVKVLNEAKIPSFHYPERAVKALGKMWIWNKKRMAAVLGSESNKSLISDSSLGRVNNYLGKIFDQRKVLSGYEVNEILNEVGVRLPPYALATSFADAQEFAHRFEYPISIKITSPAVLHKTDIGGVYSGINNGDDLAIDMRKLQKVVDQLKSKKLDAGIMVQKFAPPGIEVIIGIKKDPVYGRILLLGAGGIYAELFNDNKIIILPASKELIIDLLKNSRIGKILTGYRTGKSYAIDKLVRLIMIVDGLLERCEMLKEIEINPIIITENEIFAVDGKAFL